MVDLCGRDVTSLIFALVDHVTDSTGTKRLFFGMEVLSPWPEHLPSGRLLDPAHRHMTLAFLGQVPSAPLFEQLAALPRPAFSIAPTGCFDACLFLPSQRPNVVAWHVKWLNPEPVLTYQHVLTSWLREHAYQLDERPFLEHVTLARWPFDKVAWSKQPFAFPVVGRAVHLYESLGHLTYEPRWSVPLVAPFEPLSHTADIAFLIRGAHLGDLYLHAQMALAFEHPILLAYLDTSVPTSADVLVEALNQRIQLADTDYGVPFKAVCYHGVPVLRDGYLEWEMIVDV